MNVYQGLMDMFVVSEKAFSEETFYYELKSEGLDRLLQKYPIREIAGEGTDYERCYRVMVWLYGILIHKPDYHNCDKEEEKPLTAERRPAFWWNVSLLSESRARRCGFFRPIPMMMTATWCPLRIAVS